MTTNLPTVQSAPDPRIPILTPLLNLLKQRKFVVDLIILAVFVLSTAVPALAKYQDLLMIAFVAVTGIVLLPMTVEDVVSAVKTPFDPNAAARDVTNSLRDVLLAEIFNRLPLPPVEEQPPKVGEVG